MARLKSKQIKEFQSTQTTAFRNAQGTLLGNTKDIPSTAAVQNEFVPEDSLVIETFINQTKSSSTGGWSLTISNRVQNDDPNLVSLFINGLKIKNAVRTISGTTLNFNQIDYDLDAIDEIEVHYIRTHTV